MTPTEDYELFEILESLQNQEIIKTEFYILKEKVDLNEEDVDDFLKRYFNFFNAKPNKRLRKKIEKILKKKIKNEEFSNGPTISNIEIEQIKIRLREYFQSDYFIKFIEIYPIEQIEINVSIYGSLITGFASQYSQYRGLPSDYERVSDVDMGIVIDENAIEKIKLNGRCLFKKGIYYGPFYERNSNSLGPFVKIFDFIKGLSFAKRNDRKIGLIIVDKKFYEKNLVKDKYITLFNEIIYLGTSSGK